MAVLLLISALLFWRIDPTEQLASASEVLANGGHSRLDF
jgi:hypothetical protein